MTEYKEFRYKDPDPEWSSDAWDEVYGVLAVDEVASVTDGVPEARRKYILNATDAGHSLGIYSEEIDRYLEMLNWIKTREEGDK